MSSGLLLVAHGSSTGGSQAVVRELAAQLGMLVGGLEVEAAFLDHDEITPALGLRLLAAAGCQDAVVVPVLLSGAFHVFEDLPAQLGNELPTRIAAHLGPDDRVITALASKLPSEATSIVLCASGSTDERLVAEVKEAARKLSAAVGKPVSAAFLSGSEPSLEIAVGDAQADAVASYLLAEGLFSRQLAERSAALGIACSPVIGAHPQIAALIAERMRATFG